VVQPGFGALTDKYRNLGWLVVAGLLVTAPDVEVLFADGATAKLALAGCEAYDNGVVHLTYASAAHPE
jgi:hypothetical protein